MFESSVNEDFFNRPTYASSIAHCFGLVFFFLFLFILKKNYEPVIFNSRPVQVMGLEVLLLIMK